jgi:pyruvate dehydrogenase (quinone)
LRADLRREPSLFMVKAVMSGRGDELIDLARSNLWR